jgi:hypothetical protein
MAVGPSLAGAAPTVGSETITQPGVSTPLSSGGSATEYGVLLPAGASCPGDTAHKGYRVYSYLVPQGVPLTRVSFKGDFPDRYYGYIAEGAYYGAINTDEGTGEVPTLPTEFTWSRLTTKDLFADGVSSAVWDGGIACATAGGVVTNYWNSEIQFTASSSDPGGFTWKVLDAPSPGIDLGLWISVALIALALLFTAAALVLGRRQREGRRVDH